MVKTGQAHSTQHKLKPTTSQALAKNRQNPLVGSNTEPNIAILLVLLLYLYTITLSQAFSPLRSILQLCHPGQLHG
jgi:hypothetical protein